MSFTKKNQKGVSLYLTIVILSVLTASLLTLISLSVSQIKVIYKIGDSVVAFYAADSGAERLLYEIYKNSFNPEENKGACPFSDNIGQAFYEVCVSDSSGAIIYSAGTYKETIGRIELNFE